MRKILHVALNRAVITGLIVILQIGFFMLEIFRWGNYYVPIAIALRFISLGAVVSIILRTNNPAVKLAWIVPILMFPLFGGIMYLAFGHVFLPGKLRKGTKRTADHIKKNLKQDQRILAELEKDDPGIANQSKYLLDYAGTPVWNHTSAVYYPEGQPYWEQMLEDLEQAKHYIFLEFFILGEGKMWNGPA